MDVHAYLVDWNRLPEIVAAIDAMDEGNSWEVFEEGEGEWWEDAEPEQFVDSMGFHNSAAHAYLEIEQQLSQPLRNRLGDFVVAFAGQMMPGRTEPNDLPNNNEPRDVVFVGLSPASVRRLYGLIDGFDIDQAVDKLRERDEEQADDFMDFIEIWRDVIQEANDSARGVLTSWC